MRKIQITDKYFAVLGIYKYVSYWLLRHEDNPEEDLGIILPKHFGTHFRTEAEVKSYFLEELDKLIEKPSGEKIYKAYMKINSIETLNEVLHELEIENTTDAKAIIEELIEKFIKFREEFL